MCGCADPRRLELRLKAPANPLGPQPLAPESRGPPSGGAELPTARARWRALARPSERHRVIGLRQTCLSPGFGSAPMAVSAAEATAAHPGLVPSRTAMPATKAAAMPAPPKA